MKPPAGRKAKRCTNSEFFDWNDRCGQNKKFLRKIGAVCQNMADSKPAVFCPKVVSPEKNNLFSVKSYHFNILIFSKIFFKRT